MLQSYCWNYAETTFGNRGIALLKHCWLSVGPVECFHGHRPWRSCVNLCGPRCALPRRVPLMRTSVLMLRVFRCI